MTAGDRHAFREAIRERTLLAGFHRVGFTTADPLDAATERRWERWRATGRGADMDWLRRETPRRTRPGDLMPEARTILVATAPYYSGDHRGERFPAPALPAGKVARYAWGLDYHHVLRAKLNEIGRWIEAEAVARGLAEPGDENQPARFRAFTDSAPLDERSLAVRAGLGFIGKNTLLLHPEDGSWFLIASLMLALELPPDESSEASADTPKVDSCGSCRKCIEACPTGALDSPYEMDSRRCISWFTIEHRGEEVPKEFEAAYGPEGRAGGSDWIFGCDICQEVCPLNRAGRGGGADRARPAPVPMPEFAAERGVGPWLNLDDALSPASGRAVRKKLSATPLSRAGAKGLRRTAALIARRSDSSEVRPPAGGRPRS